MVLYKIISNFVYIYYINFTILRSHFIAIDLYNGFWIDFKPIDKRLVQDKMSNFTDKFTLAIKIFVIMSAINKPINLSTNSSNNN